jgi:hypothetical protein
VPNLTFHVGPPDYTPSLRQLVEYRLGLFQVQRVKTLGEPAVDRSEKFSGLIPLPLIAPQPRHADSRAQLPGLCLLRTRDRERPFETGFGFCQIPLWRHQGDFAGDAMDLGLVPCFLCCLDTPQRRALLCPVLWCSPGDLVLIMRAATPMSEMMSGQDYLEAANEWDAMPGEDGCPFEPKASDWGWYKGRRVALDYSTPAWGND